MMKKRAQRSSRAFRSAPELPVRRPRARYQLVFLREDARGYICLFSGEEGRVEGMFLAGFRAVVIHERCERDERAMRKFIMYKEWTIAFLIYK